MYVNCDSLMLSKVWFPFPRNAAKVDLKNVFSRDRIK